MAAISFGWSGAEKTIAGTARSHITSTVVPVLTFWGAQSQLLTLGMHTQSGHGPVGVGKIGRHLVDLQDLTVTQSGFAHRLYIALLHKPGRQG